jgi:hypothetical protein
MANSPLVTRNSMISAPYAGARYSAPSKKNCAYLVNAFLYITFHILLAHWKSAIGSTDNDFWSIIKSKKTDR